MEIKSKKEVSREIGLEVGYLCGNYFLKLEHLHYGYWTENLEVDITNLHLAQDEYTKFVISHIPQNVKTILDVGCGTGQIDKLLLDKGYKVDCLSPSSYLNNKIKELIGDRTNVYDTTYEEFKTDKRYDMIQFCESFQYLNIEKALDNTLKYLNKNGYMLICDIFKKDIDKKSALSGGHKITKFNNFIEKVPFKLIEKVDITEQTAPNMDLMNDVMLNVLHPAIKAGTELCESRHATIVKLIKRLYKKKIDKLNRKYFTGGRTGQDFKDTKIYQLLLYQKTE